MRIIMAGLMACAILGAQVKEWNDEGIAFHQSRRLTEASEKYGRVLKSDPPRPLTMAEREMVKRHAPILRVHADEPFPLKDAAVVLHPGGEWIAYHLFWEDDIDFPDDNDPCDHEVIYVLVKAGKLTDFRTYFHGRLIPGTIEAGVHRPTVNVQWGKHGSMPLKSAFDVELAANQDRTWKRLHDGGRQSIDSPLGAGWPKRYAGTRQSFDQYPKVTDLMALVEKRDYWRVSLWNNATINRHFLRYNFAAKTEWPE